MTDAKDESQAGLEAALLRLGLYQHYKGGFYVVYSKSVDENTLKPLVHYYSREKRTRWTRTLENFTELMPRPGEPLRPRFGWVRPASLHERLEAYGDGDLHEGINHLVGLRRFVDGILE